MGTRVTCQRCHTNLHQHPASQTTLETAYQHHPSCASLSQAWRDQENQNQEKKPKRRGEEVFPQPEYWSRSILLKSSMSLQCHAFWNRYWSPGQTIMCMHRHSVYRIIIQYYPLVITIVICGLSSLISSLVFKLPFNYI